MAADLSVVNAVVVIQAQIRGFLVRKKLQEVRKEFKEVLQELESDVKFVCWKKKGLAMPLVTSDPKLFKSTNDESNVVSRENDNEITRKEGWRSCSNVDETGGHSLGNEILNELHTDQVENQEIIDHEGTILERTSRSARCDNDFRKNLEFLPENEVVEMESGSEKRPHPAEKSLERQENLGGHEEFEERGYDFGADRLPQERTLYSSSDIPLNGAINPLLSSNQEVKRKEHNNGSKASPMDLGQRRSYLRDQALLSESWMSDRSFDPVEDDKTTAFTDLPTDPVKLCELRDHIGMELLWTEQAIQSRKKYLNLRKDLSHQECGSD
ncbi:unnamed protein product [Porites evermanni]|uniref:IQ domain-containing protein C n=1 Tax=Porites evermanni TaxID=104178 RepID=A0ABN8MCA6_9CNID|nr:unnamed protein product [Porites evermanni]